MTTHSNIVAWGIPWTEEPGGLPSMGSQRDPAEAIENACTHMLSEKLMVWDCHGSNVASLFPVEIFKRNPIFRNYLGCSTFTCCFSYKILEHSKLDSPEAKGNHLVDISTKNATLKGTNSSQISVMVQRDIFQVIS